MEDGENIKVQEIIEPHSKLFILVDENTKENCLNDFIRRVNITSYNLIELYSGENNKTLDSINKVIKILIENNADRNSLIINLGGGVISDIGGFTASCYKRGISYINIPTTLLSMVDASVGGKTGVNFLGLKNIIGSFYTPKAVLIDINYLKTLNEKELFSGYAEMIKHRCIEGNNILEFLKKGTYSLDEIKKSISIKNKIIIKDLKENGDRKILNFGHTIGHSIESYFLNENIFITHGECVAIGMICEYYLAKKREFISKKFLLEFKESILKIYDKKNIPSKDYIYILGLMKNDKKNKNDKIKFSILDEKGNIYLDEEFNNEDIISSLEFYIS